MAKKITAEELIRKLQSPDTKLEDIAEYFRIEPDPARPFEMSIVYDLDKIDLGDTAEAMQRAALALPGFNAVVRFFRRAQFELKLAGGYTGPILVAEGDSWFTYPRLDVVGALNNTYAISHLAAAGDTLSQILDQDEYLDEVRRVRARILLLSGGGNDALGGGDLKTHLLPFDATLSPSQHVRSSFNGLVNSAVGQFDKIFRRIAREAPGVIAICHGYDYTIPAKGKWLGKPMSQIGITDPTFQRAIVHELIDRFTLAMSRLAARYPHVVFLDNRGVVGEAEWTDELHPNPKGFAKVAAKFDTAIKRAASRALTLPAPGPVRKRGKGDSAVDSPAFPSPAVASDPRRGLQSPTGMNKGHSLHIGLNEVDAKHYGGPQTLFGCHNDARAMEAIAVECGYTKRTLMLDSQAKVDAVRKAIRAAADDLNEGDIFFLTYAGHGSHMPDFSGDEVDDGQDETWCLFDRQMLDDEIYDGWKHFKQGVRVLVVSDSCHSGSVIRSTAQGMTIAESAAEFDLRPRALADNVRRAVNVTHQALYRAVSQALGADAGQGGGLEQKRNRAVTEPLNCTVRLLSGCADNQTSGDGDINGLFTSRLLQVLERDFNGNYASFHRAILRLMPRSQTPKHWVIGRTDPGFDGQHPFEI